MACGNDSAAGFTSGSVFYRITCAFATARMRAAGWALHSTTLAPSDVLSAAQAICALSGHRGPISGPVVALFSRCRRRKLDFLE